MNQNEQNTPSGKMYVAVPVSEALPEKEGYYFVHIVDSQLRSIKGGAVYSPRDGRFPIYGVTHWLRPVDLTIAPPPTTLEDKDAYQRVMDALRETYGEDGKGCRDCADENGRCPYDNLPCEPFEAALEIIRNRHDLPIAVKREPSAHLPSPVPSGELIERAEELWDKYSEYIHDYSTPFQIVAGSSMMSRSSFMKACAALCPTNAGSGITIPQDKFNALAVVIAKLTQRIPNSEFGLQTLAWEAHEILDSLSGHSPSPENAQP